MHHSFTRLAIGIPHITVADPAKNLAEIITLSHQADKAQADILLLPELTLTGVTCGDLFGQTTLLKSAEAALCTLITHSKTLRPLIAVGLPVQVGTNIYNCAALVKDGVLLGLVPKRQPPESRWFAHADITITEHTLANQSAPFGADLQFTCHDDPSLTIGIEFGDDLYALQPPGTRLSAQGATVLLSLAAPTAQVGKSAARRAQIKAQSQRCLTAYAYAGAGPGESTTDHVYAGHGLVAELGQMQLEIPHLQPHTHLAACDIDLSAIVAARLRSPEFRAHSMAAPNKPIPFRLSPLPRALQRTVTRTPYLPEGSMTAHCAEILGIQATALAQRLTASHSKTAVIGVSGGLDSTLATLATIHAFEQMGRPLSDILAVTMPGFGTTDRTYENAQALAQNFGLTLRNIPIKAACLRHFEDIGHNPDIQDTTYENAQARERTQILMDLANQTGGLVIGTGNLSELALGWCTYGGDHISMYAINCGIPKTIVQKMIHTLATTSRYPEEVRGILQDILKTPISPELLPPGETGQRTEDLIGPYALHDFFLYHVMQSGIAPAKIVYLAECAFQGTYDRAAILKWLKCFYGRFFSQQFKRSCSPDGVQIGSHTLSPRGGWQMPSDAVANAWLSELELLH